MAKVKTSRILNAVHETAADLHTLGFIDKRKLRQYESLCSPIPSYSAAKIKALRKRYHISQGALAILMNASLSSVRQWEIGEKHPSGPSVKLLYLLDKKGLDGIL